jgi:hypothetical protein
MHMGTNVTYYFNNLSVLRIYYNDTEYIRLVLTQKTSSYNYPTEVDEDATEYDTIIQDFKEWLLEMYNNQGTILIYSKPDFNKPLTETKYKDTVSKFATEHGLHWDDITKIVKTQECVELEVNN